MKQEQEITEKVIKDSIEELKILCSKMENKSEYVKRVEEILDIISGEYEGSEELLDKWNDSSCW